MESKTILYAAVVIIGIIVILGVAYLYGPLSTDTSGDEAVEPGNNTIIMSHDQFNPNNITLHANRTVIWVNKDWSVTYTIVSDSPNAPYQSPALKNGDSFTYTFNNSGTYYYHSQEKPNLKGVINVPG
jgi:plastocyanin